MTSVPALLAAPAVQVNFEMSAKKVRDIEKLMGECGIKTKQDFFNNAFTLLALSIEQLKDGKIIASVDKENQKYYEIRIPIFSAVTKS